MPQGLSACPQRPTRPGPARGQHNGDRRVPQHPQARAQETARPSAAFSASPVRRRPNCSSTATSRWQQNQDRRAASATTNAPAAPSPQFHDSPKLAILRQPINRRPCPSGTPYSAGRRRLEFGSQSVTGAVRRQRASSRLATAGGESPCRADLRFCHNPPEQLTSASAAPCSAPAHSCEPTLRRLG